MASRVEASKRGSKPSISESSIAGPAAYVPWTSLAIRVVLLVKHHKSSVFHRSATPRAGFVSQFGSVTLWRRSAASRRVRFAVWGRHTLETFRRVAPGSFRSLGVPHVGDAPQSRRVAPGSFRSLATSLSSGKHPDRLLGFIYVPHLKGVRQDAAFLMATRFAFQLAARRGCFAVWPRRYAPRIVRRIVKEFGGENTLRREYRDPWPPRSAGNLPAQSSTTGRSDYSGSYPRFGASQRSTSAMDMCFRAA